MSDDLPRDPEHYFPSDHAVIRAKEREIDTALFGDLIQDGVTQLAKNGHPQYRFIKEFDHYHDPVALVANVETGEVITAFYYTDYNHPEINN